MFKRSIGLARILVVTAVLVLPLAAAATTPIFAQTAGSADAKIIGTVTAEYPELARGQGIKGTALVQVDLLSSGEIAEVSIAKSTGNRWLDEAALRAAREAHFDAETRDGKRVAGTYLLEVRFE